MDAIADAAALVANRYPHALWALLTGSVLDDQARTAGSDLDIVVCLPDYSEGHRDSLRWNGWPVEVFANSETGHRWFLQEEVGRRKPTLARMIATGVQIAGADGVHTAFQAECAALLAGGPGTPSGTTLEDLRYGLTALLDDLAHARDAGEATIVRHVLWERTAHLALAAAGSWDGGGKWLVRELRAWDPVWAGRWLAARDDDGALVRLAGEILALAGGPLFEGYRRTAPIRDRTGLLLDAPAVVVRRAARAILLDGEGRLVVIRRTVPDRPGEPYWVTPGGGVEPQDASTGDACLRELHEELGATATLVRQVFYTARPQEDGYATHHYYLAKLQTMDLSLRHGPEFDEPDGGSYDVELIDLRDDGTALDRIRLVPAVLKTFLRTNRTALLAEAALVPS